MIRSTKLKNLIRISAITLAGTIAAWVGISAALAHAHPVLTAPASGQVVRTSPPSVLIAFSSEIQKFSGTYSLAVKDDSGQSVAAGAPSIDAQDAAKLSVALQPNLAAGRYVVTWSNVDSADGDSANGAFSFYIKMQPTADDLMQDKDLESVGAEDAEAQAPDMSMPSSAEAMPHTDAGTPAATMSGPAEAPTVSEIVLYMGAQNGSGIDGRAEIIPVDSGAKTQIGVYLNGVAEDSSHPAHVDVSSTCTEGTQLAHLEDVVAAGTPHGRSVTVVDVPFSTVANGKNVILIHPSATSGGILACGMIPARPAAVALPKGLPQTGTAGGGSHVSVTLLSLAALALAGTIIAAGGVASCARRDR
jgi:methionine-rich copper-binding protein CopC